MEYDVTVNRDAYIGGSDVAIIMGISPFKTRYELLLEKAGLKEIESFANTYTLYGQSMEPYIRDYINRNRKKRFEPNRVVKGDVRCHTDGFNGECVLEIKTTSHIYDDVNDYKIYLVQLLLYMQMNEVTKGKLAVYARPADFDSEFDADRLTVYDINMSDYTELMEEINSELDQFRADLKRLEENPLLTEQDFLPNEIVALSNKVTVLERRMAEYKSIEDEYKAVKQALHDAMAANDIKSWQTPNGTRITRVDAVEPSVEVVTEFDLETFKEEQPELHAKYKKPFEKKKARRAGYVKITLPKV